MDDPPAEPRIVEVVSSNSTAPVSNQNNTTANNVSISSSKKQDNELQPLKSGNMADLDDPSEGL